MSGLFLHELCTTPSVRRLSYGRLSICFCEPIKQNSQPGNASSLPGHSPFHPLVLREPGAEPMHVPALYPVIAQNPNLAEQDDLLVWD